MRHLYFFLPLLVAVSHISSLQAQITFYGQGNLPIPPGAPANTVGITTSIASVSGIGTLGGCYTIDNVTINLTHTFVGDIAIFLIGPGGQVLELSSGNGGGGDNYTNTVFDDDAAQFITAGSPPYNGTFRPEGRQTSTVPPFSNANPLGTYTFANTFNGTNADGDWTLFINDYVIIDVGLLIDWSITFTDGTIPVVDAGPDQTICPGQSATLTANSTPPSNYLWSTGATTPSITVSPTVTTSYTVTAGSGACSDTDTVQVIVGGGTVNASAGPDQIICQGEFAHLVASGGGATATYTWSNGQTGAVIDVFTTTTTTYTVTVSDGGCTGTDDVLVTVSLPTTIDAGPDQTICQGESATLTATVGGSGGFITWATGQSGATITVSPPNNTVYMVTVTSGACTDQDQVTVFVEPAPSVDAGANESICEGQTVTLTATGTPGNYEWSNGANGQTNIVSPSATTLYFVTVTLPGGCSATDNVLVNVSSVNANAGPDQSICAGETATLSASGGQLYNWSNGESSPIIFVSPANPTTYSVTVTNGNCTDEDEVTVIVSPQPVADAGADQTICAGEIATLAATGGNTYSWSNGQSGAVIDVSPTNTTTYQVTVSIGSCSSTDAVTVVVNTSLNVSAGPDLNLCEGETTTLVASGLNGPGTYTWNTGETGPTLNVTPAVSTAYSVTATAANSCSGEASVTVFVNPLPNANAGPDVSICEGNTATLTATGGSIYSWSTGQAGSSISVSPVANATYSVTVTENGCTSVDEVEVTVQAAPAANAGGDETICTGEPATLTATGGGTYQWSNGQSGASITVNPAATTIYTVTVSNGGGCTATDQAIVTVNPLPPVNAGTDLTICAGDTGTLSASGGNTYTWSDGQTGASISVSPAVTTNYSVTSTDNGCTGTDVVTVFVTDLPTANAGPNVSILSGESTTLTATGGGTYQWSNGQSGASMTVSPAVTTTYTVTVTLNGCTAVDEVTVFVNEPPVVDLGPDLTICAGESVTLDAGSSASNNTNFAWNTGATTATITVSPPVTTNYSVTLTFNGFSSSDTVTVFVNDLPLGTPVITGEAVICEGSTVNYSIAPVSGATAYTWSVPLGAAIATGQGTTAISVDWGTATSGSVSVFASNDCGDAPAATLPVTVNQAPVSPGPISDPGAPCATSSSIFSIAASPDVQQYNWSVAGGASITAGQGTTQISVDWNNSPGGQICISAANQCGASAETCLPVATTPEPVADAGTDAAFCGTTGTLSASGNGVWSIAAGNAVFGNENSPVSSVNVGAAGAYIFTWTVNENGCTDSDDVTIDFNENPAVDAVSEDCNATNTAFTVSFDILGGQAPFLVNGVAIAGSGFTSAEVVSGDPYSFVIEDANGCESLPVSGTALCNCATDVGGMLTSPLDVCDGNLAAATYLGGESLDGDDVLGFVLHDGSFPAGIIGWNDAPEFAFSPPMAFETTYFISAVVGSDDGSGLPGLNDPCLSVSPGTPVVFHALPSATLDGDASLCEGECADLVLTFQGTAPFNVVYGDGSDVFSLNNLSASFTEILCPLTTTTYTLQSVGDAHCTANVADAAVLTVGAGAEAGVPAAPEKVCAGVGQPFSLPTLLTGEAPGGVWAETSAVPSTGGAFNGTAGSFNTAGQAAGTYQFSYTVASQGACPSATAAVEISILSLPTADAGTDKLLNCSIASATLGSSGTAGSTYLWSNGASTPTIQVVQPGNYALTVTDGNGCSATDAASVNGDFAAPVANIEATGDELTCNDPQQFLSANPHLPSLNQYLWSFNDATNVIGSGGTSLAADEAGCYILTVTNTNNGCEAADTFCLTENTLAPSIVVGTPGQLTCTTAAVTLDASATGGALLTFSWSTTNGNIVGSSNSATVQADAPGDYSLIVTDPQNGCEAETTVSVSVNTTPPVAVASAAGSLDCKTTSTTLSGTGSSVGSGITYVWNTADGQLQGNANLLDATAAAAGEYTLTVTSLANGCTATASTSVVSLSGDPSAVSIFLVSPRCPGECNGSLKLDDLGAGLLFSMNGSELGAQNFFENLCSGTLDLQVQDAFGCEWDTVLQLSGPPAVFVELGADTLIELGETIEIQAVTGNNTTQITWSPADPDCGDVCFNRLAQPLETTTYKATVADANGCVATDEQTVLVRKIISVFVPNAFSPNDDGFNDVLLVFTGNDVATVRNFRIFSRWGEAIFELAEVRPGVAADGWDGTFRGKEMDPAVFVYIAEVEFIDGRRELVKGGVTLVR